MSKAKLKLQDIKAAPTPEAKVTPLPMAAKHTPHYAEGREFRFANSDRPIVIVKHAVNFFCPVKEAPDTQTLVSVKGGKPVPLAISYAEFKAWWEAKSASR